jgi:DNA-binding transcriptional LysR family regulator
MSDVAATRRNFDPQSIERTYVIAMRDLYVEMLIPRLADILALRAPKASLRVIPWDTNDIEMQLGTGVADLGIGVDPPNSTRIAGRKLLDERFVCVAAKGVLKRRLTMKDYANLRHIVVTRTDTVSSPIDLLLAEQGLTRRVGLQIPYFSAALAVVAQSAMVMTAPERLARRAIQQSELEIVPVPFAVPGFAVHIIWHERFGHDPLNRWLREQLGSI